ncbi:MAG: sugar ABC transporter permease [Treponema sp.]|jgi:multiple sugar transport system permease protein|nr:sugar ABC transporter permease [Treponema sp.]
MDNRGKIKRADTFAFFAFASPWIIGFLGLTLVPMGASLFISLTKWNILTPPVWIGLNNFKTIFTDPLFFKSVKVTLTYAFFSVPLIIILSIFFAMVLNNNLKGMKVFRTITYLPAIVSGVVISLLWKWIYNPDFGILNSMLRAIGIVGPDWIFDQNWALPSLIIMSLWGIGGNMVLYLAGLQSIPTELYEASHIDGANFFVRLFSITIPGISPVLLFTLLTGIIGALQTFTQAFVMTNGGPNNATHFYAFYIYKNAFTWRKMGEACAQAWILFVIIFIITTIVLKATGGHIYYGSAEGDQAQ